ncbi:hypothetical protein NMY22_g16769 [Coprinellus aureogranulatus]|nr:hypothetical protein NMY22_g16769 [Coprinellus aureogranulatus]
MSEANVVNAGNGIRTYNTYGAGNNIFNSDFHGEMNAPSVTSRTVQDIPNPWHPDPARRFPPPPPSPPDARLPRTSVYTEHAPPASRYCQESHSTPRQLMTAMHPLQPFPSSRMRSRKNAMTGDRWFDPQEQTGEGHDLSQHSLSRYAEYPGQGIMHHPARTLVNCNSGGINGMHITIAGEIQDNRNTVVGKHNEQAEGDEAKWRKEGQIDEDYFLEEVLHLLEGTDQPGSQGAHYSWSPA